MRPFGNRIFLVLERVPREMMTFRCGAFRLLLPMRVMASVDCSERLAAPMVSPGHVRGARRGCRRGTGSGANGLVEAPKQPGMCICGVLQSARAGKALWG